MKLQDEDYEFIVRELGLDIDADIDSTKQVEKYLREYYPTGKAHVLDKLQNLLKKPCLITGAGSMLEQDFNNCIEHGITEKVTNIAVDGTCSLFYQLRIRPQIVVTDLDGDWDAIVWAIKEGAVTLIHAHGDNLEIIKAFFKNFRKDLKSKLVWGSTQNDLKTTLFNFGGFTDGDRAIFLCFHFQTPLIGLIGFDFGEKIGKYSTINPYLNKDVLKKQKKFKIALSLISKYSHIHKGMRVNLTSRGEKIEGFKDSIVIEFSKVIDEWYERQKK
jgi:uncharacterized Rossmann fold enzyme